MICSQESIKLEIQKRDKTCSLTENRTQVWSDKEHGWHSGRAVTVKYSMKDGRLFACKKQRQDRQPVGLEGKAMISRFDRERVSQ